MLENNRIGRGLGQNIFLLFIYISTSFTQHKFFNMAFPVKIVNEFQLNNR